MKPVLSTRFPSLLLLAGAMAAVPLHGCGRAEPGLSDAAYLKERPRGVPAARTHIQVSWNRELHIGGERDDTTLVSPMRLSANRDGVYLIDYYPRRIARYGHDGRLSWHFGRMGGGPDEFRDPRDLKLDRNGRVWVMDPANARVSVLRPDGGMERRISLAALDATPMELVPGSDGGAILVSDGRTGGPLARVDSAGRVLRREAFPWAGFPRMEYLASQVITASSPATGEWSMAFRLGDGFFSYTGARARRGWFVEHVPFPEVVVTRSGNTTTREHRGRPTSAAISLTMSPSTLYVLFGGTTRERGRLVDTYSLADGKYGGTYLLPRRVTEIAWHDGGLYTLAHRPYPELAFWRPIGTRLP